MPAEPDCIVPARPEISDLFAACANLGEHGFDALLVDRAQALGADAQADKTAFVLQPETALLEIGQEAALGFVVGVGNVVTHHRRLPGNLANAGHVSSSRIGKARDYRVRARFCSS